MKKIRKLTPATLKRIIAEEKSKLLKEAACKKPMRVNKTKTKRSRLLREIAMILTMLERCENLKT